MEVSHLVGLKLHPCVWLDSADVAHATRLGLTMPLTDLQPTKITRGRTS